MQTLKKHKKKKKNTICEHACANWSCQNVRFFFCMFNVCRFSNFHFSEMFLRGCPKIKEKQKYESNKKINNSNNNKIRCKKQNKSKIVIQNKTRQQAEQQKQKNILKQKANKTITKSKDQKLT